MPRKRRPPPGTMRGVVYGRQSKTKGESESRENQDEACTRTAELHGVEVVAHLIEPPSTGAYRGRGHRRPKWPTLLEMIRTGQANVVVAYQTNRLSRGGGPGWAPLIEAAEAADLDPDHFVLIANNGFMSEFELGIRASMDREESKKKSENLCDMKERMAKAGKPSGGGLRPFGFEDDRVTVVEAEAAMIRQAAERIASGGTLAAICREWNDQGLVSGRGKPWRVSPLRNILTNPRVAGLRTHNLDEHGRPVVVADATWPAILDRSTFDRVCRILLDPKRKHRRTGREYLLSGILRCGRCGQLLNGKPHYRSTFVYACKGGAPGVEGCGRLSIVGEPTERLVLEWFFARVERKDFATRVRRKRKADAGDDSASKELVAAEQWLEDLAARFGSGQLSEREWKAMRQAAQERRDAAASAVTVLERPTTTAHLDFVDLRERWEALSRDERRAYLGAVMERVEVSPGRGVRGFDTERISDPVWRI